MIRTKAKPGAAASSCDTSKTGIAWFDAVAGGLPTRHLTLLSGDTGTGKTILSCQLAEACWRTAGIKTVFIAFEEDPEDIIRNTASLNLNLARLKGKSLYFMDARPSVETVLAGKFDLIGLLASLSAKARATGASLVIFDGVDQLLQWIDTPLQRKRELVRIGEWLKAENLTGILTAKAGLSGSLAEGLEDLQFMMTAVLSLERHFEGGVGYRTIRVLKRRGFAHSTVSYVYFILASGVEPIDWQSQAPEALLAGSARVSSGMQCLDALLGGGYYVGSTVLVSGAPGTGKSTLGGLFADSLCASGKRLLYVAFDEPSQYLIRNLGSVGIRLARHLKKGNLELHGLNAGALGPEQHLATILDGITRFQPEGLVIDPASLLCGRGPAKLGSSIMRRLVAEIRQRKLTAVLTSLLTGRESNEVSASNGISTIADAWLQLSYFRRNGERNRALSVIKARGTAHSKQTREFVISAAGCRLKELTAPIDGLLASPMRPM